MAILLLNHGAFRLEAKYIEHRNNTYYFRRRIPKDVQRKYVGKKTFDIVSLKTNDPSVAAKKAHQRAAEQDALWQAWRNGEEVASKETRQAAHAMLEAHNLKPNQYTTYRDYGIEPDQFMDELRHLSQTGTGEIDREQLPDHARMAEELFRGDKLKPLMSDAVELYEKLTGAKNSEKSKSDRRRVLADLYALAGDIPVEDYTRSHANALVERLGQRGNKTGTIKRKINYIAPVVAHALREFEIEKSNVFHSLNIPDFGEDQETREPYSASELDKLRKLYLQKDDDIRWVAAMLQDTGARLAEILGLRIQDIILNSEIPHIRIKAYDQRRLKSKTSAREVPLVGTALWAANRVVTQGVDDKAFPRYWSGDTLQATHASNTINKSLRTVVPRKSCHCFRHAMRDRLRDIECPNDLADQLGGWKTSGVGEGYGRGYGLPVKNKWLKATTSDFS